jgi:DNA-binding PadR family transcriptional regulator
VDKHIEDGGFVPDQDKSSAQLATTPPMFHVLLALADAERHGYAIMQEVEGRTDGEVQLPPGTLYRTIKLLLNAGLIERRIPDREPIEHDTRRVYYRITRSGRKAATIEAARLAKIVALARAKKLIPDLA